MGRIIIVAIVLMNCTTLAAQETDDGDKPLSLTGTWGLKSSRWGDRPEQTAPDASPVLKQKHFTGTHFCAVTYNESGTVMQVIGGTYTLNGNVYLENIEYCGDKSMVKGPCNVRARN